MQRMEGQASACSSGIIIGRVQRLISGQAPIEERHLRALEIKVEQVRLHSAAKQVLLDLDVEYQHIISSKHHELSTILDTHRLILQDQEFIGRIHQRIEDEKINAEWSLRKQINLIQKLFEKMDDEYLRSRFQDINQIGQRILHHLGSGTIPLQLNRSDEPCVFITDDIAPADVISLWRTGAAGIISDQGGINAHTVIIARGIGLPMLIGTQILSSRVDDGDCIILDAERQCYIINPDESDLDKYKAFSSALEIINHGLHVYVHKPSASKDGHILPLMANIEFEEEVAAVHATGADGVGLFRTEFIFLRYRQPPDENVQYAQYLRTVKAMQGKQCIFRLLDIGGDKAALFQQLTGRQHKAENPALGMRGVRLLLKWPKVLESQLRAILRASCHGPVSIMVPMVTTTAEMESVRQQLECCAKQLGIREIPQLGCMIEVPAAVMIADELAQESDFFSIGSNDLIQYCMAADRNDEASCNYYDSNHAAVKKMILMTVQAAQHAEIPTSLCGELAGNSDWTEAFLNMGIDSLSMSTSRILPVRRLLARINYQPD